MSVQAYGDDQADLSIVAGRRVGVIGFGDQGRAQALCLRDSGVAVRVGLADTSARRSGAVEEGFTVGTVAAVAAWADLVVMLVPDAAQHRVFADDVAAHLSAGDALVFGSGFAIRYGLVSPPSDVDAVVVAPAGPGHLVRRQYADGKGVPVLIAVDRDATGGALALALSYAKAIGGTQAVAIATTVAEQAEAALFGEQAVRAGVAALVQAGFEVLTDTGYAPPIAYLECLHALKQMVDAMYRDGIAQMRRGATQVAEYGGYTRAPRVVNGRVRQEMRRILGEIRAGDFTREWLAEQAAGGPHLAAERTQAAAHPIEASGAALRATMSWLDHPDRG